MRAAAGRALLVAEGMRLLDGDAGGEQAAARLAGVGFHAMRHTHATNLGTDSGVDAATLARRLGHSDPAFTARRYVHVREDRVRELAMITAGRAQQPRRGSRAAGQSCSEGRARLIPAPHAVIGPAVQ